MWVVNNRKIFYFLSGLITAIALLSLIRFGLNFGIDFKGGTLLEVEYVNERPSVEDVSSALSVSNIDNALVRPTGEKGLIVRTKEMSGEERNILSGALSKNGVWPYIEKRSDSVGPTLGGELKSKALISIFLVIFAIVIFIAFAFRKVSEPVSSWKYGAITIVALLHDVIVPTGVFAILGHFSHAEIDGLFVTALLVILGFSVHDTIVVFDRVRENLRRNEEYNRKEEFEHVVGRSVSQTFARSINTSLTTLLTLAVLYLIGPETTKYFSLALLIGIAAGTYSSIFLASPLLVTVEKLQNKK